MEGAERSFWDHHTEVVGEQDAKLAAEVPVIAPLLHVLHERFVEHQDINDIEFACMYVLSYCRLRAEDRWLSGKLSPPVVVDEETKQSGRFKSIHDFPLFRDFVGPKQLEKLRRAGVVSLVDLFGLFRLDKVPSYVNTSIVEWANGRRDIVLLFHVPTPQEVLAMQARGARCLSGLVATCQLDRRIGGRCPKEFLMHDLQHMEKFHHPLFFHEQVGLFFAIDRANFYQFFGSSSNPLYDSEFFENLDYAVSDMNACCLHVLQDFKAKWIMAEERKQQKQLAKEDHQHDSAEGSEDQKEGRMIVSNQEFFVSQFRLLVGSIFDHPFHSIVCPSSDQFSALLSSFDRLCSKDFSEDDGALVRSYFDRVGHLVLADRPSS